MNDFILLFEILLDLIILGLGITLVIKSGENKLQRIWGILVFALVMVLLLDNIRWFNRIYNDVQANKLQLLDIGRMMKWFALAVAYSLFPIALLRPGWLTASRITIVYLPVILSSLVCLCYLWFGGEIAKVYSIKEILANADKTDMQIRLVYFVLSVVVPLVYFLVPITGKWLVLKRRMKLSLYLYITGCIINLTIYLVYTLAVSEQLFSVYGFVLVSMPCVFSIQYLYSENPFSEPRDKKDISLQDEEEYRKFTVSPVVYDLYEKMNSFIEGKVPFTNPEYSFDQLAADMDISKKLLLQAIQYAGFTSFKEYINYQRLEYFKLHATWVPKMSIKELMYKSGFTSRSSFYRHFAEKENMSPTEYIERNCNI